MEPKQFYRASGPLNVKNNGVGTNIMLVIVGVLCALQIVQTTIILVMYKGDKPCKPACVIERSRE